MCIQCVRLLEVTYHFIENCMQAEDKLKEVKKQVNCIVQEGANDNNNLVTKRKMDLRKPGKRIKLSSSDVAEQNCNVITDTMDLDETALLNSLNKEMEYVLSACEQPLIIAPDDLPIVNGSLFTMCNPSENSSTHQVLNKSDLFVVGTAESRAASINNLMSDVQGAPVNVWGVGEHLSTNENVHVNNTNGNSKLQCTICGKQFSREENLRFHEKTHNNSNLFQCNTCSKTFSDQGSLINHLASHKTVNNHMTSHKILNSKLIECDLCAKFFHESCIADHEEEHQKQASFTCRVCHKSFSKKGLLIYHLKTHTNDERYNRSENNILECETCKLIPVLSNMQRRTNSTAVNGNLDVSPLPEIKSTSHVGRPKSTRGGRRGRRRKVEVDRTIGEISDTPPVLEMQQNVTAIQPKGKRGRKSGSKNKTQTKPKKPSKRSLKDALYGMPVLEPQIFNHQEQANFGSTQNTNIQIPVDDLSENLRNIENPELQIPADDYSANSVNIDDPESDMDDILLVEPEAVIITISDTDSRDAPEESESQLSFNTAISYVSCELCLRNFPSRALLVEHCKHHLELQCVDCDLCFTTVLDPQIHDDLKHQLQCFQCMKCDVSIVMKANFIEHITGHDAAELFATCKVCYLLLNQKFPKLLARFKLFTGRETFQCDICCKILQFTDADILRCNICNLKFLNRLLLSNHAQQYRLLNVKCITCNVYFHGVDGFEVHAQLAKEAGKNECILSHKRNILANGSMFNCVKCCKAFNSQQELQLHCRELEHYKCDDCSEIFSDWIEFGAHLEKLPLLSCGGCGSFILGNRCYREHTFICYQSPEAALGGQLRTFDSQNILCIKCKNVFSKKENLIDHVMFAH